MGFLHLNNCSQVFVLRRHLGRLSETLLRPRNPFPQLLRIAPRRLVLQPFSLRTFGSFGGFARVAVSCGNAASVCARLEYEQERAWPIVPESNASLKPGSAYKVVSSNGVARTGTGQGNMRSTTYQGTAGYVTRMSGGVGGMGREVFSYPD